MSFNTDFYVPYQKLLQAMRSDIFVVLVILSLIRFSGGLFSPPFKKGQRC